MKKLLVVASFAAFSAYPAAACEWNQEASANDAVVAAAVTPAEQTAAPASPQATSVAVDVSARKPIDEPAPIVLITDRH